MRSQLGVVGPEWWDASSGTWVVRQLLWGRPGEDLSKTRRGKRAKSG